MLSKIVRGGQSRKECYGAFMSVETRNACVRLVGGCLVMAMAALPLPVGAAQEMEQAAPGGMLCTDQMVTDPYADDMEAIPVVAQVDGGCMTPDGPVAI